MTSQVKFFDLFLRPSKVTLVNDWRRWYKWWSAQAAALIVVIQALKDQITDLINTVTGAGLLPTEWAGKATVAIALWGFAAKFISQWPKDETVLKEVKAAAPDPVIVELPSEPK